MSRVWTCLSVCLLLAGGCANLAADHAAAVNGSAAIAGNLSEIHRDALAAASHSDAAGKALIAQLDAADTLAQSELLPVNKALADNAALQAALKREQGQFFSDRQRALFWWTVLAVTILGVVYAALFYAAGFAPLATLAVTCFHVLTAGIAWVVTFFTNSFHARAAVAKKN